MERAAYAVLAEAVGHGARRLHAVVTHGQLTISSDVAERRAGADGVLPDLIAALGGRLGGGPEVEAVIPCG